MIQLTKRTEYGLIALIHLADHPGQVVSVREVVERYPVPKRLLSEVLKDLGHAKLVESTRGAAGGYRLARQASDITLGEIIASLEGAPSLTNCEGLGDSSENGGCDVHPVCPIRSPLQRITEGIWKMLESTTLQSLASSSFNPSPLSSPQ